MRKYRKNETIVEAMQWDGRNANDIVEWAQGGWERPAFQRDASGGIWIKQKIFPDEPLRCLWFLMIPTPDGEMEASPGDWIIKRKGGELYPCKPEIFAKTYESVEASTPKAAAKRRST